MNRKRTKAKEKSKAELGFQRDAFMEYLKQEGDLSPGTIEGLKSSNALTSLEEAKAELVMANTRDIIGTIKESVELIAKWKIAAPVYLAVYSIKEKSIKKAKQIYEDELSDEFEREKEDLGAGIKSMIEILTSTKVPKELRKDVGAIDVDRIVEKLKNAYKKIETPVASMQEVKDRVVKVLESSGEENPRMKAQEIYDKYKAFLMGRAEYSHTIEKMKEEGNNNEILKKTDYYKGLRNFVKSTFTGPGSVARLLRFMDLINKTKWTTDALDEFSGLKNVIKNFFRNIKNFKDHPNFKILFEEIVNSSDGRKYFLENIEKLKASGIFNEGGLDFDETCAIVFKRVEGEYVLNNFDKLLNKDWFKKVLESGELLRNYKFTNCFKENLNKYEKKKWFKKLLIKFLKHEKISYSHEISDELVENYKKYSNKKWFKKAMSIVCIKSESSEVFLDNFDDLVQQNWFKDGDLGVNLLFNAMKINGNKTLDKLEEYFKNDWFRSRFFNMKKVQTLLSYYSVNQSFIGDLSRYKEESWFKTNNFGKRLIEEMVKNQDFAIGFLSVMHNHKDLLNEKTVKKMLSKIHPMDKGPFVEHLLEYASADWLTDEILLLALQDSSSIKLFFSKIGDLPKELQSKFLNAVVETIGVKRYLKEHYEEYLDVLPPKFAFELASENGEPDGIVSAFKKNKDEDWMTWEFIKSLSQSIVNLIMNAVNDDLDKFQESVWFEEFLLYLVHNLAKYNDEDFAEEMNAREGEIFERVSATIQLYNDLNSSVSSDESFYSFLEGFEEKYKKVGKENALLPLLSVFTNSYATVNMHFEGFFENVADKYDETEWFNEVGFDLYTTLLDHLNVANEFFSLLLNSDSKSKILDKQWFKDSGEDLILKALSQEEVITMFVFEYDQFKNEEWFKKDNYEFGMKCLKKICNNEEGFISFLDKIDTFKDEPWFDFVVEELFSIGIMSGSNVFGRIVGSYMEKLASIDVFKKDNYAFLVKLFDKNSSQWGNLIDFMEFFYDYTDQEWLKENKDHVYKLGFSKLCKNTRGGKLFIRDLNKNALSDEEFTKDNYSFYKQNLEIALKDTSTLNVFMSQLQDNYDDYESQPWFTENNYSFIKNLIIQGISDESAGGSFMREVKNYAGCKIFSENNYEFLKHTVIAATNTKRVGTEVRLQKLLEEKWFMDDDYDIGSELVLRKMQSTRGMTDVFSYLSFYSDSFIFKLNNGAIWNNLIDLYKDDAQFAEMLIDKIAILKDTNWYRNFDHANAWKPLVEIVMGNNPALIFRKRELIRISSDQWRPLFDKISLESRPDLIKEVFNAFIKNEIVLLPEDSEKLFYAFVFKHGRMEFEIESEDEQFAKVERIRKSLFNKHIRSYVDAINEDPDKVLDVLANLAKQGYKDLDYFDELQEFIDTIEDDKEKETYYNQANNVLSEMYFNIKDFDEVYEFIDKLDLDYKEKQLLIARAVNRMIEEDRFDTLDKYPPVKGESGESIPLSQYIKGFVEKYDAGNKGHTILVLSCAREYQEGLTVEELWVDLAKRLQEYERIFDSYHPKGIPEGYRASIGIEYEVGQTTIDHYEATFNGRDYKEDVASLSAMAKIGKGADYPYEFALYATDNPYILMLEVDLLQGMDFIDFNFGDRKKSKRAKDVSGEIIDLSTGTRGLHLTIGGEKTIESDEFSNFLQNTIVLSQWGGISTGMDIDRISSGRNTNLREKPGHFAESVFEDIGDSIVEFRGFNLDRIEQFERMTYASYMGAIAIQAVKENMDIDYKEIVAIMRDNKPENADQLFKLFKEIDYKGGVMPVDESVREIIFNWFKFIEKTVSILNDHNNNFYDNEMNGYFNEENGEYVNAEIRNRRGGFKSVVDYVASGQTVEEYCNTLGLNVEDLFREIKPDFINTLSHISYLYFKPPREDGKFAEMANPRAALSTTKLPGTDFPEEIRVNGHTHQGDVLTTSIFERKGVRRDGFYSFQAATERMVMHAAQIAFMEFIKDMERTFIQNETRVKAEPTHEELYEEEDQASAA